MTKCSNCGKEASTLKTVIRNGEILDGCNKCLNNSQQGNERSAKFNREWQKKEYRKELTQYTQGRDYAKAYPDQARELYGDDLYRKLS